MLNKFLLFALFTLPINSFAVEMEKPFKVDMCAVVKNPQMYDGEIMEINARQVKLKKNEWGLYGYTCPAVFLLAFPEDINPKPLFILEKTDAINELLTSRKEHRATFGGDFVGRFDWAGTDKKKRFGQSKQNMRFVLQSISNPIKIILPYK